MSNTLAAYKGRSSANVVANANEGISEFWPFLNGISGTPFEKYELNGGSVYADTISNGLTSGAGGIAFSVSGSSSPDVASVYLGHAVLSGNFANPPETLTTFETAIFFDAVPTGSRKSRVKLGFSRDFSTSGLNADWGGVGAAKGAFFCFDPDVSNYWICKLQNQTQSVDISTITSITPVADTTVYFKIVWNQTKVFYYINGSLVANHAYTFIDQDYQSVCLGAGIKKTGSTVYTSMICRGIKLTQKYSTGLLFT